MSDNFFDDDIVSEVLKGDGSYEIGPGEMEPLPDNLTAIAEIVAMSWKTFEDEKHGPQRIMNVQWSVLQPIEYRNRRVFQKLWVNSLDPRAKDPEAKRKKHKGVLLTIDKAHGGNIYTLGREPTDDDLERFLHSRRMTLNIKQWKMKNEATGEVNVGNWVSYVAPASTFADRVSRAGNKVVAAAKAAIAAVAPSKTEAPAAQRTQNFGTGVQSHGPITDKDIPF